MSMIKYVLENGLKANIWINDFPDIIKEVKYELLVEENTETYTNSKQLVVELSIPRLHNNYALLGIDFISDYQKKIKIKMSIENQQKLKNNHSLALSFDKVTWGILEEYKQGVIDSLHMFLQNRELPSGTINYNIAAYGEIGSSQAIFEIVSNILLSLLLNENICEDTALTIVKKYVGIT